MILKEEQNKKGRCEYHDTQSLVEIRQDKDWIISTLNYTELKCECSICGYIRIYTESNSKPIKVLL
jgi:hypothetical protein